MKMEGRTRKDVNFELGLGIFKTSVLISTIPHQTHRGPTRGSTSVSSPDNRDTSWLTHTRSVTCLTL